jgi:hypothetical protein
LEIGLVARALDLSTSQIELKLKNDAIPPPSGFPPDGGWKQPAKFTRGGLIN